MTLERALRHPGQDTLAWAPRPGGGWYVVSWRGVVYVVQDSAAGRTLVTKARVAVIPSKRVEVADIEAARSYILRVEREA